MSPPRLAVPEEGKQKQKQILKLCCWLFVAEPFVHFLVF